MQFEVSLDEADVSGFALPSVSSHWDNWHTDVSGYRIGGFQLAPRLIG